LQSFGNLFVFAIFVDFAGFDENSFDQISLVAVIVGPHFNFSILP